MAQEAFNTGKRSLIRRKNGTGTASGQMTHAGEQHDALMNPGTVLTNIGVSLLVMMLLAVCFRF
jgi:hypothetical protein